MCAKAPRPRQKVIFVIVNLDSNKSLNQGKNTRPTWGRRCREVAFLKREKLAYERVWLEIQPSVNLSQAKESVLDIAYFFFQSFLLRFIFLPNFLPTISFLRQWPKKHLWCIIMIF